MKTIDRTFKLLLSIMEDRFEEAGKINLCHRIDFGDGVSYTINLKSVKSVKEGVSFLFQVYKGSSIPVEFIADSIKEGLERCKTEIEDDSFIEIIPPYRQKMQAEQYIAGVIGGVVVTISILYVVVSFLSYRGELPPGMQAGMVFSSSLLAIVGWVMLFISNWKRKT